MGTSEHECVVGEKELSLARKPLEEVKAEMCDVEVECCLKLFSQAHFEMNASDIQYYTGFPNNKLFDVCMEF